MRLARCHNVLGNRAATRDLLEVVLKKDPEHGLALRTRAQMAQMDGDIEDAERDLREAVRVMPFDAQSHWLLQEILRQRKKPQESAVVNARYEKLKEAQEKLAEVSRQKLSLHPNDPALHAEMGTLLMSLGHEEVARRWLLNAVKLKPDLAPAHAALADYYRAHGDTERAADHQRQAGGR